MNITYAMACSGLKLSNCSFDSTYIQADPDITGIGVILYFVITNGITTLAIYLGYIVILQSSEKHSYTDEFFLRLFRIKRNFVSKNLEYHQ